MKNRKAEQHWQNQKAKTIKHNENFTNGRSNHFFLIG